MPAINIQYSFQDEAGKSSSTSINIPSATTAANAAFAAQAAALLIDEMTDAKITGISITLPVTLPAALKDDPIDGARVNAGIRFQWNTAGGYLTACRIPARKEALVLDGTDVVDESATAVANFIAEMTAGLDLTAVSGTGTVAPSDTRGDDIVSLDEAVESFTSSRR